MVNVWASRHLARIPFMYFPVAATLLEGFAAALCEQNTNAPAPAITACISHNILTRLASFLPSNLRAAP